MEKYSHWRDPGTGISPFLPPVPASDALPSPIATALATPVGWAIGLVRTALVVVLVLLRVLLTLILFFIPNSITLFFTSPLDRLTLLILGYLYIKVEWQQPRKKYRHTGSLSTPTSSPAKSRITSATDSSANSPTQPKPGDIIFSNWTSYVDVLYLSFRYSPLFLVPSPTLASSLPSASSSTCSIRVLGFFGALRACGRIPERRVSLGKGNGGEGLYQSLEDAVQGIKKSGRVGIMFLEATTSNNRGILRFADVPILSSPNGPKENNEDSESDGSKRQTHGGFWFLTFKHPPPSCFSPVSATCPLTSPSSPAILSRAFSPLGHVFRMTNSVAPRSLLIRRTPASFSTLEELVSGGSSGGAISNTPTMSPTITIAAGLGELGRLKRTGGLGWVEKEKFSEVYSRRRN